jgi:predicted oxidoreductase
MGVNPSGLRATIDEYNRAQAAGENGPFGRPGNTMAPITRAPFYGIEFRPIANGTLTGLKVSENCEIVNDRGAVVPNLYGVGELVVGNIKSRYYFGSMLFTCLGTGRVAGEHIKTSLLRWTPPRRN